MAVRTQGGAAQARAGQSGVAMRCGAVLGAGFNSALVDSRISTLSKGLASRCGGKSRLLTRYVLSRQTDMPTRFSKTRKHRCDFRLFLTAHPFADQLLTLCPLALPTWISA